MPRPRINHEQILRIHYAELKELTIFQLGMLIKLASMAAVSPLPGYVCGEYGTPLTLEQIAEELKTTYTLVSKNVELLQNAGFIVLSDQGISIINWPAWMDTRAAYQRELMRRRRQKGG
jgi:DNA-binding MarR family transcriptional regulator